ncbi:hypothetical protein Y032_0301g1841 [Ancylostoma ceylanicum]|uniref:Uncharacterized protein n=1 Tax=Ancylostoma ceylanicum TaxID=53326 RepID=A0A016S3R0_9BILA|nr:hypothetical protein Y032_0301g1841 [Ancylostoma ceylanicum]
MEWNGEWKIEFVDVHSYSRGKSTKHTSGIGLKHPFSETLSKMVLTLSKMMMVLKYVYHFCLMALMRSGQLVKDIPIAVL